MSVVGCGSSGEIVETIYDGKPAAIKKVKYSQKGYLFPMEIICGLSLEHSNICEILQVEFCSDAVYILMELAETNLKNYKHKLNFKKVAAQLLSAVNYLHQNSIIHGDIKPSNILVFKGGKVKLADFGCAVYNLEASLECTKYTRQYRAPEVWDRSWDEKADVWALGCTLYELYYGRVSYPIKGIAKDHHLRFEKDIFKNVPEDPVSDFLRCMLVKNPEDRWSAERLLSHPFLDPACIPKANNDQKKFEKLSIDHIYDWCEKIDLDTSPDILYFLSKITGYECQHEPKDTLRNLLNLEEVLIEKISIWILSKINDQQKLF